MQFNLKFQTLAVLVGLILVLQATVLINPYYTMEWNFLGENIIAAVFTMAFIYICSTITLSFVITALVSPLIIVLSNAFDITSETWSWLFTIITQLLLWVVLDRTLFNRMVRDKYFDFTDESIKIFNKLHNYSIIKPANSDLAMLYYMMEQGVTFQSANSGWNSIKRDIVIGISNSTNVNAILLLIHKVAKEEKWYCDEQTMMSWAEAFHFLNTMRNKEVYDSQSVEEMDYLQASQNQGDDINYFVSRCLELYTR